MNRKSRYRKPGLSAVAELPTPFIAVTLPNMTELDPAATLKAGIGILGPTMIPHGFTGSVKDTGRSSGGPFAAGEFRRGNRALELHFRFTLGLVRYHLGSVSLSHEDYMWSVIGQAFQSHYPGFSDKPLDGFRHLRMDLEEHAQAFLTGSDADFLLHVDNIVKLKRQKPRLP